MPKAGLKQPPEKWPTYVSANRTNTTPTAPSKPSLVGDNRDVFVTKTIITSIKVQIISIMNTLATVRPGAGLSIINSDNGTDPLKWLGNVAVYLFYMLEKAISVPNIAPAISENTVNR